MADAAQMVQRSNPLSLRLAAGQGVQITPAKAAFRISLRVPQKSAAAISKALGITLPKKPKTSESKGGRAALWLGPDEWLVIDEGGANPAAALSKTRSLHAAVDVSHRNTAIIITGPEAETVLSAGCPQDLSMDTFPVGACSRTIFGKAEVVLWRTGENTFRLECWRSFSTYVFDFLEIAARDAGT